MNKIINTVPLLRFTCFLKIRHRQIGIWIGQCWRPIGASFALQIWQLRAVTFDENAYRMMLNMDEYLRKMETFDTQLLAGV